MKRNKNENKNQWMENNKKKRNEQKKKLKKMENYTEIFKNERINLR